MIQVEVEICADILNIGIRYLAGNQTNQIPYR
jgi:hypothetical protein